MDDLEYLTTYPTKAEAEAMKTHLENNGIKCLLRFNDEGGVMEGMGTDTGPTDLYVLPGHLDQARQLAGVPRRPS